MGGGTSSLSPKQSAEIARLIKQEYERCKTNGLSDEESLSSLSEIYQRSLRDMTVPPARILSRSKPLGRGISHAEQRPEDPVTKPSKPTNNRKISHARNRSFDELPTAESSASNKKKDAMKTKAQSLGESSSVPTLSSTAQRNVGSEANDSWDSVHDQPACLLCKMVFSSPEKLNNHIKYSSLHASNMECLEQSMSRPGSSKQVEPNSRCYELYSGSKFFWRSKDNIDILLYLHISPKCVEVIAFDQAKGVELPRLYVSEPRLLECIGVDVLEAKVQEREKAVEEQEGVPLTRALRNMLVDEERRLLMSSMLLSRLQLSSTTQSDGELCKTLSFSTSYDGKTIEILSNIPSEVVPVKVVRRRVSSSEEISSTMQSISDMHAEIQDMTAKAEKIVYIINDTVKTLKKVASPKGGKTAPRKVAVRRWQAAVHKVIIKNGIAQTTKHLKRFGGRFV